MWFNIHQFTDTSSLQSAPHAPRIPPLLRRTLFMTAFLFGYQKTSPESQECSLQDTGLSCFPLREQGPDAQPTQSPTSEESTPFDITFNSRSNRFANPFILDTPPHSMTHDAMSLVVSPAHAVSLPKTRVQLILVGNHQLKGLERRISQCSGIEEQLWNGIPFLAYLNLVIIFPSQNHRFPVRERE